MYSMTKKELIDWLVIQQTSSYSVVQSLVQWRQREFKVGGDEPCPPAWLKRIGGVL